MDVLGIITLNNQSEKTYITEIGKRASHSGMECVRFIPSDIQPTMSNKVAGQRYDSITMQWVNDEFPVPKLLYDRCFYGDDSHSKQCASIVSWLKNQRDISFLGYGLPNKLELYQVLKQTPLKPYLPETKPVQSPGNVLEELHTYRRIVLKPINGLQGYGIYYIEHLAPNIIVKTFNRNRHIQKEFPSEKTFQSWISSLISIKDYLVQPYLELTNNKQEPFDLRVLLQKKEDHEWTERGRGIRIGHPDGILSNLHAGGRIESFESLKKTISPSLKEFYKTEIEEILVKIPILLESSFLPLFELGVDIGIAKNGALWILDINSKPGRKVILETSPDISNELYFAPLLYGKSVINSIKHERKRDNEKTLSN